MTDDQTERDLDAAQALSDETPEPEPDPEPGPDDDDDDGGDDGETPEPEPEQSPAANSQALMEQVGKKLDGLQKHVTKRVGEILGDEAQHLVTCELCSPGGIPGWRWDMEVPADVAAGVLRALGQHSAADREHDPYSQECPTCRGWGMVASGSKVTSQSTLVCVSCNGRGWMPVGNERAGGATIATNGATAHAWADDPYTPPAGASLEPEPAEVALLRAQGYAVIAPAGR